jgi:hypothetical protein
MKLSLLQPNEILLDSEIVLSENILNNYMESISRNNTSFKTQFAPKLFPTAIIFGEIFKLFELPKGTIHLSQKTTNSMPVFQNSKIHTIAKITKNTIRGGNRILTLKINIYDQNKNSYCESISNLLVQEEK